MNWYYIIGEERQGPVSDEQLHALAKDGVVTATTFVWHAGLAGWQPYSSVAGVVPPATAGSRPLSAGSVPAASAAQVGSLRHLTLQQLRDCSERSALTLLYVCSVPIWIFLLAWTVMTFGGSLLILGFVWLARWFGECWFAAYLRTNAVRVSERQLPELHRAVQACCAKLNLPAVEVYVLQDTVWNAFAMKLRGRRTVVLLSGAVDAILLKGDDQQLLWVVGHELGHHAAGHLDWSRKLAALGGWFVWAALWHSRRAEFTCDRIGLYCAGSLRASQLALASATVGAQLASRIDLGEAQAQWATHGAEFFVKYRALYSTHPALLCRMEALAKAAPELGVPA